MDEMIMNVPLSFLVQVDLFAKVLEKHCPEVRKMAAEDPALTIRGLITDGNREEFLADLAAANEAFNKAMLDEVKEFGVEADPFGLRTQWGTEEVNEQVVRMIEEQYPAGQRKGEILFYGPSNITLWFSLEKDMAPYKAQNHGMGGCIDDDLMRYAPRLLYPYEPKAVFFQTGSNDIAGGEQEEDVRHVPREYARGAADRLLRASASGQDAVLGCDGENQRASPADVRRNGPAALHGCLRRNAHRCRAGESANL